MDTLNGLTDADLVARARRGSAAAFEGLVRRYFRAAYSVALGIVGNTMDAEDVCQDAFLKALERLEDCRQPDRFAGWLMQIVRNRAFNLKKYVDVRAGPPVEEDMARGAADVSQDLHRRELKERLEQALTRLTENQRQVVLLHDLEGWRHREIAEALDFSEGMSRQHLFAARKILRRELGADMPREYFS